MHVCVCKRTSQEELCADISICLSMTVDIRAQTRSERRALDVRVHHSDFVVGGNIIIRRIVIQSYTVFTTTITTVVHTGTRTYLVR